RAFAIPVSFRRESVAPAAGADRPPRQMRYPLYPILRQPVARLLTAKPRKTAQPDQPAISGTQVISPGAHALRGHGRPDALRPDPAGAATQSVPPWVPARSVGTRRTGTGGPAGNLPVAGRSTSAPRASWITCAGCPTLVHRSPLTSLPATTWSRC